MQATRRACTLGLRAALPRLNARHKSAYEGEGRMTVHVLNQDLELGIMIDSYSTAGFKLNNGITVLGPMVLFPRTVLSWQVKNALDVTKESMQLFTLLEPKVDLVVIGLESGERSACGPVLLAARALGLNVELLATEHACSTFNFLTAEGRNVAAALIPPLTLQFSENDIMQSQLHYQNIYEKEY